MTDQSNPKLMKQTEPQNLSSSSESGHNQAQGVGDPESLEKISALRRKSASKREIMEELSRERFPWEE